MGETPDPIQELLVTARRNQILEAATRVFAEKGFHRATIKDIARTAGIADGTIYTYFASKTSVLLALLNRLNESSDRAQHMAASGAQDLRTFFRGYLRHRIELVWSNAEVFQAVLPEVLSNADLRELYYNQVIAPSFKIAEQSFQLVTEEGSPDRENSPLAIRAITGMILGLLMLHLLGDEEVGRDRDRLADVVTELVFDGLKVRGMTE